MYSDLDKTRLLSILESRDTEIKDLKEALKQSDDQANSLNKEVESLRIDVSDSKSLIEELEAENETLKEKEFSTLVGEQKQEIIEKLKRLDLKTLEAIEFAFADKILGFEQIID